MNLLLWVLQVVLAWLCIAGGAFQIFKFDDLRKGVNAMRNLPRGLWAGLGGLGILTGFGLVVPWAFNWMPILTPVSAVVVSLQSLFITVLYAVHKDKAPLRYTLAMAALAAFVAYGRFVLTPL